MNDDHESELPDDNALPGDPILDEAFLQLRRLGPSADGRKLNRAAVADALQGTATAQKLPAVPWWRKTIAVPVPVAAALVMFAALLPFSSFYRGQTQSQGHVETPTQPPQSLPAARGAGALAGTSETKTKKTAAYFENETYLCGIGRLKSESGWIIPEENK